MRVVENQTFSRRIKYIAGVVVIVDKFIDPSMVAEVDADMKLGVLQREVGEMPCAVFDLSKLVVMHQEHKFRLRSDLAQIPAHAAAQRSIAAVTGGTGTLCAELIDDFSPSAR